VSRHRVCDTDQVIHTAAAASNTDYAIVFYRAPELRFKHCVTSTPALIE